MHKPRIDPEFKSLIPPLTTDEYSQLEQNILAHGCRDPIALWRDKIVDGHNRFEICTKHGTPFKTVKLRFPGREAVKLWILDNQLGRRNLSDATRIELAARKVEYMGYTKDITKRIAQAANLSERTIRRYIQIKGSGKPKLMELLISGDYKIGTAHRHADIITTTREEWPVTEQTPEEKEFVCVRAIVNHIRHIEAAYIFLKEHYCNGLFDDAREQLGLQCGRVEKIAGALAHSCVYN